MAETPFLRLTSKQFLTGLAPNAHTDTGGIFYKANGITPMYDAGGTASPENGLLQAGATPTDFTGSTVVDIPLRAVETQISGAAQLYILGASGHFYKKAAGAGAVTDLRSGTPIANPANGMTVWGPAGGTPLLYYWMQGFIGTWNMVGSYPTGWSDTTYTITQGNNSTVLKPVHQFVGNVYYGNGDLLGAITDAGSATATHNSNVLDFPTRTMVTSLTDDGQYLVIATTENTTSFESVFSKNKIYFWDTFSSSWSREVEIRDPFIWCVQNIGGAIYAFGQYGIYQVTFAGGAKKILSRLIGFGTNTTDFGVGYGSNRAMVYGDALMFGTDTTVDTFGKIEPDVPSAYFKPFKIPSGGGRPSMVSASLDAGRVFVGTTASKLYAFDFNAATHDSGNTAQTVYFSLPSKTQVNRIDLVFGEPLVSGDAVSAGIFSDEDTAVKDFGSATFAANGAIRRKSLVKQIIVEDQISIQITFTSGAVKIKAIEVYGEPMTA